MTNCRYFLRSDVNFCVSDNNVVFRNTRTDAYLALPIATTVAFRTAVVGWPDGIACQPVAGKISREDSYDALEEMLNQGLLTTNPSEGKKATPFAWPEPASSLWEDDTHLSGLTLLWHFFSFISAARVAASKFRARVLDTETGPWKITPKLIESIGIRRNHGPRVWDRGKAQRLARVARELRPWYKETPVCTLDSLIIIEFFALLGLHPHWIFGVQANPPDAHCWLQHDDVLINDTVDVVTQFTPIMAA